MKNIRKSPKNVTRNEYLKKCILNLSRDRYLELEAKRKGSQWSDLVCNQEFKCYYCETDIRLIQKLIQNGLINMRKRGLSGFSGLHFELEHKNADNKDNSPNNLAAVCYYCNNDKSNTITEDVYKRYFAPKRKMAFDQLLAESGLQAEEGFLHNINV